MEIDTPSENMYRDKTKKLSGGKRGHVKLKNMSVLKKTPFSVKTRTCEVEKNYHFSREKENADAYHFTYIVRGRGWLCICRCRCRKIADSWYSISTASSSSVNISNLLKEIGVSNSNR